MEAGQDAAIVENFIRPIIDGIIRDRVLALTNLYRSNDTDHDQLLGRVAEISALRGLIEELESRQRQGIIARNRELGDAT